MIPGLTKYGARVVGSNVGWIEQNSTIVETRAADCHGHAEESCMIRRRLRDRKQEDCVATQTEGLKIYDVHTYSKIRSRQIYDIPVYGLYSKNFPECL